MMEVGLLRLMPAGWGLPIFCVIGKQHDQVQESRHGLLFAARSSTKAVDPSSFVRTPVSLDSPTLSRSYTKDCRC